MEEKQIPISQSLEFAWNTFKSNAFLLIGAVVVQSLVSGAIDNALESEYIPDLASWIMTVLGAGVKLLLDMGLIAVALKFIDGRTPDFGDLINRYPLLFNYAVASIIYGVMVIVGLALFIVPGIYLAVRFYYYGHYIVDQEVGPITALQLSSELTQGVRMELFAFGMLIFAINLAGLMLLIVGTLVSWPISIVAIAYVYRRLQPPAPGVEPGVGAKVA